MFPLDVSGRMSMHVIFIVLASVCICQSWNVDLSGRFPNSQEQQLRSAIANKGPCFGMARRTRQVKMNVPVMYNSKTGQTSAIPPFLYTADENMVHRMESEGWEVTRKSIYIPQRMYERVPVCCPWDQKCHQGRQALAAQAVDTPVPCANGGQLIHRDGQQKCECAPGFQGPWCQMPDTMGDNQLHNSFPSGPLIRVLSVPARRNDILREKEIWRSKPMQFPVAPMMPPKKRLLPAVASPWAYRAAMMKQQIMRAKMNRMEEMYRQRQGAFFNQMPPQGLSPFDARGPTNVWGSNPYSVIDARRGSTFPSIQDTNQNPYSAITSQGQLPPYIMRAFYAAQEEMRQKQAVNPYSHLSQDGPNPHLIQRTNSEEGERNAYNRRPQGIDRPQARTPWDLDPFGQQQNPSYMNYPGMPAGPNRNKQAMAMVLYQQILNQQREKLAGGNDAQNRPSMNSLNFQNPPMSLTRNGQNFQNPAVSPSVLGPNFQNPAVSPPVNSPSFQNPAVSPSVNDQNFQNPAVSPSVNDPNFQNPAVSPSVNSPNFQNPAVSPSVNDPNFQNPALLPSVNSPNFQNPAVSPSVNDPNFQNPAVLPSVNSPNFQNPAVSPSVNGPNFQNLVESPSVNSDSKPRPVLEGTTQDGNNQSEQDVGTSVPDGTQIKRQDQSHVNRQPETLLAGSNMQQQQQAGPEEMMQIEQCQALLTPNLNGCLKDYGLTVEQFMNPDYMQKARPVCEASQSVGQCIMQHDKACGEGDAILTTRKMINSVLHMMGMICQQITARGETPLMPMQGPQSPPIAPVREVPKPILVAESMAPNQVLSSDTPFSSLDAPQVPPMNKVETKKHGHTKLHSQVPKSSNPNTAQDGSNVPEGPVSKGSMGHDSTHPVSQELKVFGYPLWLVITLGLAVFMALILFVVVICMCCRRRCRQKSAKGNKEIEKIPVSLDGKMCTIDLPPPSYNSTVVQQNEDGLSLPPLNLSNQSVTVSDDESEFEKPPLDDDADDESNEKEDNEKGVKRK